jgi:hypothetical protein
MKLEKIKLKGIQLFIWMSILSIVSTVSILYLSATPMFREEPLFSFGVIADCQYCSADTKGIREYRLSKNKLEKCVAHFNKRNLAFVVHLGDFIDRDFASYDVVIPIYNKLIMPRFHALGNHDFNVEDLKKEEVPAKLGMASRYYSFEVKGWRFIVLDGNDISAYAYPRTSEQYGEVCDYFKKRGIETPQYGGVIGPRQLAWPKNEIDRASASREKAVLFSHFPVYPEGKHNLSNASELIDLIEDYPGIVKAYIDGHNHAGAYGLKQGTHYLTLKGMVDTKETAYAIIHVFDKKLVVDGFGREEDRSLAID